MSFPTELIGTACIVMQLSTGGRAIVGTYDEQGYCVVRLGPWYARPPMQVVDGPLLESIEPDKTQTDLGPWK